MRYIDLESDIRNHFNLKAVQLKDMYGNELATGMITEIYIDYFTRKCINDPEVILFINDKKYKVPLGALNERVCLF